MKFKPKRSKLLISGEILELYEYKLPYHKTTYINIYGRAGKGETIDPERRKKYREMTLSRAKRTVKRLINANLNRWGQKPKFLTLTFAEHVTDIRGANYEFKKFRQRLEYKHKIKLKYVAVVEFQKSGRIHYHVIIFNLPYTDANELAEVWANGFIKINAIDNIDNVGAYVVKYMTKDIEDERLKGEKCYFTSRGLKKPKKYYFTDEETHEFKETFKPFKQFECEYNNDYFGKVYYSQYKYKNRLTS